MSLIIGVTFIGVPDPGDGSEAQQEEFIARMNPQVSHVLDEPLELWVDYEVLTQPTMVFVSADGTQDLHSGGIDAQDLLDRAKELAA